MTRRRVLACTAALLLPGALAAQDTSDTAAPDSTCSAWAHSLREHGASAFGVRLDQRRECVLDDSTVAGLWRTIGTDTTQLLALAYVTVNAGGARPLRTLLQTLTERERPAMVRLAALVALVPYLDPADICAGRLLDTLRAPSTGCWATHPSYHASSSIEPLLRDSIRARLREAASEPGAVGRAAAGLSSEWSLPERWSDERAAWCRRSAAAFGPALRMSAAVLTSDELLELAECTESGPAALMLGWQGVPADSTALRRLVQVSAVVRDRRLFGALLAVARDAARPVAVRAAAVDAIAPLLHPALYWFSTAASDSNRWRSCSAWGFFAAHEAVQEEGAEPMGPASRRAGVAELDRLAGERVPLQVAHAARTVARCAERLLDSRPPETW